MNREELRKYCHHLPTCSIMQDWSEAEQAMADTPQRFRDESWQSACDEMRVRKNTCTCGLDEMLVELFLLPPAEGAEEILQAKLILNKYWDNSRISNYDIAILAMTEFATLHAQRIAEKMVEWISVKDKLPEEHEDVLCYNGHRISSHNWCKYTGQDDKWFKETFTHWGKLPKLPKS